MFFSILLLPFLGFIYSGLFGKSFGRDGSNFFSIFFVFLSFFLALFAFYEVVLSGTVVTLNLFSWTVINIFTIDLGLLFDALSCSMVLIVTGISSFVHLYSLGYMSHDPHMPRFMSYLSLFTFFMLLLVVSDNFIQFFFAWEGLGLTSYLLINFWYTRILANKGALKAMLMNRIADVFFLIAIISIFLTFKTTNFLSVFQCVGMIEEFNVFFMHFSINFFDFISFFLLLGACGKSAQFGFHVWLPASMNGPTPVSSLLHSSTMVCAGVFLIIRCSPIIEFSPAVLYLMAIIGLLTALLGGVVGIFQYDVKAIVAYSTTSQLGYMFFSCGLSNYHVAIFHLLNHAFFKCLLFLAGGALIHSFFDLQDIRKMGSAVNFLPLTYFTLLVASLALMGFPFLTGFFSKDLILELSFARYLIYASFVHFFAIAAAFCTAIYSTRFLLYVFFVKTNTYKSFVQLEESSLVMSIPLIFLVVMSIFWGFLTSDLNIGWGSYVWNDSIFIFFTHFSYIETEFLSPFVKNMPLLFSFFGVSLCVILINLAEFLSSSRFNYFIIFWNNISAFLFNAAYFDVLYNKFFNQLLEISYIFTNKWTDQGILQMAGPYGFYKIFRGISLKIKSKQPSNVFFSIGWIFFSIVFFMLFLFFHINFFIFLVNNPGLSFVVVVLYLSKDIE